MTTKKGATTRTRAGRRGNGEGSKPYQRGDGRWQALVTLSDGTRRTITGVDRQTVQERMQQMLADDSRGVHPVANGKMTLGAYLDQWITREAAKLDPASYLRKCCYVRHITGVLGKVSLSALSTSHVQTLYDRKLTEKTPRGTTLSTSTVHHLGTVLREALEDAVRECLLARNVAKDVDLPRMAKTDIQFLTSEEVEHFRDAARAEAGAWGPLWYLALTSGCREGELLGLQWRDLDLERGMLTVRGNLKRISSGRYALGTTKTATSRRTFTLDPQTVEVLRQHRARQLEQQLHHGDRWQDTGLVFTNEDGGKMHPGNLYRRQYKPFLRRWGLPDVKFHALRHSYATYLISHGVDAKTVSRRLGHADVTTTQRFYGHVTAEMEQRATAVWAQPVAKRQKGTSRSQAGQGA